MTNSLLSYKIQSMPAPLTTQETGGFAITATNPTDKPVTISRILLAIPLGTGASSLCQNLDGAILIPPEGWTKDVSGSSVVFTPPSGGGVLDDGGLVMQVNNFITNGSAGAAMLTLMAEGTADDQTPRPAVELSLLKIAPGLAIDYFYASSEDAAPNGSATLNWKGSPGASYVISYDDQTINHVKGQSGTKLPADSSYVVDGLVKDTTFTLIATKTGYSDPATAQVTVSVVEAKVVTFSAQPPNPVIGEPVVLSWTATGTSVTLDPGGHVFPSTSEIGQTGTFTVTPTSEKTKFTLTATQGALSDEQQLSVKVQAPTVGLSGSATSIPALKDITLDWSVSNAIEVPFTATVKGAVTGYVYHNSAEVAKAGTTPSASWTGLGTFPLGVGRGGGEPVVQSIAVQVLPGMEPVTQSRTIPYDGPNDLKITVPQIVPWKSFPSVSIFNGSVGDTLPPEADSAMAGVAFDEPAAAPSVSNTRMYVSVHLVGSIQNVTSLSVWQPYTSVPWWIKSGVAYMDLTGQTRVLFAEPTTEALPLSFNTGLVFYGTSGELSQVLQLTSLRASGASSGIIWRGFQFNDGLVYPLTDPPPLETF